MIKILYTGIGATKDEHTEVEFLAIMKKEFIDNDWENVPKIKKAIQLFYNDWVLPRDFSSFSLLDWIDYSGASLVF